MRRRRGAARGRPRRRGSRSAARPSRGLSGARGGAAGGRGDAPRPGRRPRARSRGWMSRAPPLAAGGAVVRPAGTAEAHDTVRRMVLVVDHYDSFTYNLVQLIEGLGRPTRVVRSDERTAHELVAMRPDAVVLSPGPGHPSAA